MKLKAIVASLVTLGLSGPVLAMQPYMLDTSYQMDVMRYQVNKLDMILDRNQPGGFDQPCGWTCRINVSGWINTDAYFANQPPVFVTPQSMNSGPDPFLLVRDIAPPTQGRASDLFVNNANLFVDARVNNWVTANLSLVYASLSPAPGLSSSSGTFCPSHGAYVIPASVLVRAPLASNFIDTAYATIGNSQVSPLYFRVGKEYVPFGQYDPYAFMQSENPTQLFSAINAATAQLGFVIPNGFYGSVYTFAGNPRFTQGNIYPDQRTRNDVVERIQNGGVDLGYAYQTCNSKVNLNAGYIANIADSNFLVSYYHNVRVESAAQGVAALPNQKTPAWNVNADVQWGPFDANAHYIDTTRNLAKPFLLGRASGSPTIPDSDQYQKPAAWGVELGLTFPVVAHQSRLAVGYQGTKELQGLLPQRRYYADYMVNIAKWVDLGFAVSHNKDYALGSGLVDFRASGSTNINNTLPLGTGHTSTVGQLRASIKFA